MIGVLYVLHVRYVAQSIAFRSVKQQREITTDTCGYDNNSVSTQHFFSVFTSTALITV